MGSHIDDSLSVSDDNMRKEVLENMKKKFTYGSHENLPFRYVGLNIDENEDGIMINQDHFVENLTPPNLNEISSMKKEDLLPNKYQTEFRSVVSKLNMLSMTSRPDITFEVKILTTKYGKAKKMDIMTAYEGEEVDDEESHPQLREGQGLGLGSFLRRSNQENRRCF